MRDHRICFCLKITKFSLNYPQWPLLSGALGPNVGVVTTCIFMEKYVSGIQSQIIVLSPYLEFRAVIDMPFGVSMENISIY